MTQDEIIEIVREAGGSDVGGHGWTTWVGTQSTEFLERFANLVAAKEREALAQPEQEPVAWGVFDTQNLHDMFFTKEEAQDMARLKGDGSIVKPLYTHSPKENT